MILELMSTCVCGTGYTKYFELLTGLSLRACRNLPNRIRSCRRHDSLYSYRPRSSISTSRVSAVRALAPREGCVRMKLTMASGVAP